MLPGTFLVAAIALTTLPVPPRAPAPLPPHGTFPINAAVRSKMDTDVANHLCATHSEAATIAIVENGKIVYSRRYGMRDSAAALPADIQKRYEVGSITKQFAAAAILQLKEAGKIELDAFLAKYVPQAPHGWNGPLVAHGTVFDR